ncbi:hypothetical protein BMT55_01945 [Listeria newyorkensis]|uniref:Phage protein n=1 Tax=Listeria newyorkensis TaxID=1497681 RepID=A0ABX4XRI2_9LIST|nr:MULTISPECIES: hypothetical protein [Listeria]KGL46382.1 hypothetical protein EP56_01975 [Listeriaceae bacterium FSL A5-0209]KGL41818.1 hypothetical protein EP58_09735 [Listeria newyorkensis]KMT58296.1 hypothetical protein X559_3053 [Listeria newyorkensis]PNP94273.1 hypothetical protein BMT55_01945 [Listeria newyorkensis]RQW67769.1 hypothetical protein DUK53_05485 [Listeria sp. SHR_NRA_18]
MTPFENIMTLEKQMTANGYWYRDVKKDLRMLVLAISNHGMVYVEAMDTKKSSLMIRTQQGNPLCYLERNKVVPKPKRGKAET